MKRLQTTSDIASVLVGNKNFAVAISNGLGDGWTNVYVYKTEAEFYCSKWHFETVIFGSFNIYDYDCCDRKEENIIQTVKAKRTACYNNKNGAVAFVIWE